MRVDALLYLEVSFFEIFVSLQGAKNRDNTWILEARVGMLQLLLQVIGLSRGRLSDELLKKLPVLLKVDVVRVVFSDPEDPNVLLEVQMDT